MGKFINSVSPCDYIKNIGDFHRRVHEYSIEEGVFEGKDSTICSLIEVDFSFDDELIKDLLTLYYLILDLPKRIYYEDMEIFGKEIGVANKCIEAIKKIKSPYKKFPVRWDLIKSESQIKVIELNTGYCLGGYNNYNYAKFLFDAYPSSLTEGKKVFNPFYDLFKFISSFEKCNIKNIIVLELDEIFEEMSFYRRNFVRNLKENSDFNVWEMKQSDLEGYLLKKSDIADTKLMPMYTISELIDSRYSDFFINFLSKNPSASILNFEEYLYSSKGVFCILSNEKNQSFFTNREKEVIARRIPRTCFIGEYKDNDYKNIVLKPCLEYGGKGVIVGSETTEAKLKFILSEASDNDKQFIIQDKIESDCINIFGVDHLDNKLKSRSPYILGLLMHELQLSNVGFRGLLNNEKNDGVINVANGAALGSVICKDYTSKGDYFEKK